jgi:hypothetical protein
MLFRTNGENTLATIAILLLWGETILFRLRKREFLCKRSVLDFYCALSEKPVSVMRMMGIVILNFQAFFQTIL